MIDQSFPSDKLKNLASNMKGLLGDAMKNHCELMEAIKQFKWNQVKAKTCIYWKNHSHMPSTLLTSVLKKWDLDKSVDSITDSDTGLVVSKPEDVLNAFSNFYSKLFSQRSYNPTSHQYLLNFWNPSVEWNWSPVIDPNVLSDLIDTLPSHKSPGADGLSYEIFKHCKEFLLPLLVDAFTEIRCGHPIPQEWKMAHIITIYKGKGNRLDMTNQRPIS